jgi:phospholipase A-2-activating protein
VVAKKLFSFETKAIAYYDDVPASTKLFAKLIEFNELVDSEVKLSQTDIEDLESVMKVIRETSRYHVSVISEAQVRCLVRPVLGWTAEYCFPLFDILRIICIHPVGAEAISKLRDVDRVAERALSILSEQSHSTSTGLVTQVAPSPAPYPTCLTASRFLCNVMRSDTLRSKVFSTATLLSSYISMVDASTSTSTIYLQLNKLIRVSISRILTNFTSPKAIILLSEDQMQVLLGASQRILASERESAEVMFNALQAIGTILVSSSRPIGALSSAMKQALQQQLTSSLQHWNSGSISGGGLGDNTIQCLQEVLGILSS